MPLLVGTSGWQYRDWRGEFYAAGLPVRSWLEHYAARFPAVENNGMFYRLAGPATVARLAGPDPGRVRHGRQGEPLPDSHPPAARSRRARRPAVTAAGFLDDRLGPILLQLPPTMRAEPALLARCLSEFSGQHRALSRPGAAALRIGVEFRHPSWLTGQVRQILADSNAALVWSDRRGRPLGPLWRTADWGYLRLHEGAAAPWPSYGRRALQSWLGRITSVFPADADVFAFFNNDQRGAAPRDAAALTALTRRAGWAGWPAP